MNTRPDERRSFSELLEECSGGGSFSRLCLGLAVGCGGGSSNPGSSSGGGSPPPQQGSQAPAEVVPGLNENMKGASETFHKAIEGSQNAPKAPPGAAPTANNAPIPENRNIEGSVHRKEKVQQQREDASRTRVGADGAVNAPSSGGFISP